jgi:DNA-binding CsgD family transcriptional regulator
MNAELIRSPALKETLETQRLLRVATSPREFPDLGPAAGSAAERELAVECDGTAGQPFRLSELWQQLRAAEWCLRDAFSERDRWYAIVGAGRFRGESERARCSGMAMLEDVLLGQTSKVVAIDRNLSASAVAYTLRGVLDGMGLSCRLRGVPQLLMLAARLARSPQYDIGSARIARLPTERRDGWVISVRRPKLDLLDALSRAERQVMLQVLDGCDYKQIAQVRRTSVRTVANQVTMSFRKLEVSGRAEVVDLVLNRAMAAYVSGSAGQKTQPAGQVGVTPLPAAICVG